MKAIVFTQYGSPDVMPLAEVAKPTPKDDEVLIKVYAASVNAADWHVVKADPFLVRLQFGMFKPKFSIPGADIAGRVEAVGRNIKEFKVGDEVFGDLSSSGWGGFAEYVCAKESMLVLKPANITFEQAAAAPMASVTALKALRDKVQLQPGQKVLINGASGGVGTFTVQLAKFFGANVTAVCSTKKVDMVRSLGADHVIDYTKEDFTKGDQRYDLIIGANGNRSLSEYKRVLAPNGVYVMTGGSMSQIFQAVLLGPLMSRGDQKMGNLMSAPNKTDLAFVAGLLESGKVKPLIDRCYPLAETADALGYVADGHASGKVVITVTPHD